MCLLVVALHAHERYALVLAANRDEYHARPAAPAAWGRAAPFIDVLGGRDLAAGGTWLGLHRDGRFALVTNVREGAGPRANVQSRGELVPRVLDAADDPAAALRAIAPTGDLYSGFNLLAGSAQRIAWMSNRSPAQREFTRGIHGLSNALLDVPWPKVVLTRAAMTAWAADGQGDVEALFDALADRTLAPDAELPGTGVTLERERMLSAPFIVSEDYGTRCSTVLTISHDGNARFEERTFDPRGNAAGQVVESFRVRR